MVNYYGRTNTWKNEFYTLWNVFFVIWFIAEYCLYHSVIDTISVVFFIVIGLLYALKKGFKFGYIGIWIFVFTVICWMNIVLGYSINISNSYEMLYSMIKDCIFLVMLAMYINNIGVENFKSIYIVSCFISTIIIILISIFIGGSIVVRETNGIFNANYLAVGCSIASILVISKKDYSIYKKITVIIWFSFFCALAGTRKAILAIVFGGIIYFCAKNPKELIKNIFVIIIGVLISFFVVMKIPVFYNTIGFRFLALFDFMNGGNGDGSIYMRSWYIKTGLALFPESPIWGHGLNCFKTLPGTMGRYSHNNYIEILFSLGLMGGLSFYCIHVASFVYGIKNYKKNDLTNTCLGFSVLGIVLFSDYAMVSYYERCCLIYIVMFFMLFTKSSREGKIQKL